MASIQDEFERRIVSISMPVDILAKLDIHAKHLGINRSAAITSLVSQALDQTSAIEIMAKLMEKYEDLEKNK